MRNFSITKARAEENWVVRAFKHDGTFVLPNSEEVLFGKSRFPKLFRRGTSAVKHVMLSTKKHACCEFAFRTMLNEKKSLHRVECFCEVRCGEALLCGMIDDVVRGVDVISSGKAMPLGRCKAEMWK